MAHFALLNENNIIDNVIVIEDEHCLDGNTISEQKGRDFIASLGIAGNWMLTSNEIRNKPASPGDAYNAEEDIFVLNENVFANYLVPWQSILLPEHPSVLFDAAVRSANQFSIEVINQMCPGLFQRWGYLTQHNPESFTKPQNYFDVIATVVRNPLDSIASDIYASKAETNEEILNCFNNCSTMLESINNNKLNLSIFKFEDVIANPSILGETIANKLNIDFIPYNETEVLNAISRLPKIDYYAMPVNNKPELEEIKTNLLLNYSDKLTVCNNIYAGIVA